VTRLWDGFEEPIASEWFWTLLWLTVSATPEERAALLDELVSR